MAAPGVVEARLTTTAPFCAAAVEKVGAAAWVCVVVPPPLPLLLPPHPHSNAVDKTIAISIASPGRIPSPQHCAGQQRSPCSHHESTGGIDASNRDEKMGSEIQELERLPVGGLERGAAPRFDVRNCIFASYSPNLISNIFI